MTIRRNASPETPIFDTVDISAGATTSPSDWILLDERCVAHGANFKFAGSGILQIYYEISIVPDVDFLVQQGNIISGALIANSPFHPAMSIRPTGWLRFYGQEQGGVDSITAFTMYFVQTGRSSS